jgi:hypothetical protein
MFILASETKVILRLVGVCERIAAWGDRPRNGSGRILVNSSCGAWQPSGLSENILIQVG